MRHAAAIAFLTALMCHTMAGSQAAAISLASDHMALRVDSGTGALVGITAYGRPLLAAATEARSADVSLDGKWLMGNLALEPKLVRVERTQNGSALAVTQRLGPCEIIIEYRMVDSRGRVERTMVLRYTGKSEVKLKGVSFRTLGIAAGPDATLRFPVTYPPNQRRLADVQPGRRLRGSGHFSPLIVQLAPDRSLLFMTDGRVEPTSVWATSQEGTIDVAQSVRALARLKPGSTHRIGPAHMTVIRGDEDAALRHIWTWFDDMGIRVPADRPDWVRDAVLYSFHPGGTIGSRFSDLGGFKVATDRLLPTLPSVGATAVWILPVEDAAPYHPRDYYQFQKGLGTPEEYRALVAKAHGLGLHVIQDIVPHGGTNYYPRAKAHPEWLLQDESGGTLSYWCFDFNWPSWQRYMAGVAAHYVKHYDVDGYRIDACGQSKMPNWNPDIPYARASMALTHGGLGMISSIRGAVKQLKPREGAVLAETQGAPYHAVADMVYDFTWCYGAMPDLLRCHDRGEFVDKITGWLYEQQRAEPRQAVRLRHIESHDSLRSQGWYGVKAMRAIAALSAWIDGVPMIYHGMEVGHRDWLRRIHDVRRVLPELRRGEAVYREVEADPKGVFTCLRRHEGKASLVVVSFLPDPAVAAMRVPKPLVDMAGLRAWDMMAGQPAGADGQTVRLSLEPYGATVIALRPAQPAFPAPGKPAQATMVRSQPAQVRQVGGETLVESGGYEMRIDRATGFISRATGPAGAWLGPMDLFHDTAAAPGLAETAEQVEASLGALAFRRAGAGLRYRITYDLSRWPVVGLSTRITGEGVQRSGLALRLPGPEWSVQSAEGTLRDRVWPRSGPRTPADPFIYWRAQGTGLLWQSLTAPLAPWQPTLGTPGKLALSVRSGCDNVALAQAYARALGPHVLAFQSDPHAASLPAAVGGITLTIAPYTKPAGRPAMEHAGVALRHNSTAWEVRNSHFRVALSRTGGMIDQLWTRGQDPRLVIQDTRLYTDYGLGPKRTGYGAEHDNETGCRVWTEPDQVRLRFHGKLRARHRFDLLRPPVDFYVDYLFTRGPSFRVTWGLRPSRHLGSVRAFMSSLWPVPAVAGLRFSNAGRTLAAGPLDPGRGRTAETKKLPGAAAPDRVELFMRPDLSPQSRLLTVSDIESNAPAALANVFVHEPNLFFAWLDGDPRPCEAQWYEITALVTPGPTDPQPAANPTWLRSQTPAKAAILTDGSFEDSRRGGLVSIRDGKRCPFPGPSAEAWHIPPGGSITAACAKVGRCAARVDNPQGAYALFRQPLALSVFPPGSKVRLSAWVKGEGIVRGDPSWKVGCVRLACYLADGKTRYLSSQELLGTFAWRQVEATHVVPADTVGLSVEVGLNGSTGTLWIDAVEATKVQ